jgi:hypothetical protein
MTNKAISSLQYADTGFWESQKTWEKHLTNGYKILSFVSVKKPDKTTFEGRMKRLLALLVLCLPFVLLCLDVHAQRYEPHGSCQWEDAQVQRLTFDQSSCRVIGLYLGNNDKLCVFYDRWSWDPLVQPYRDTLMVVFKEGEAWSQPQKIGYEPFDLSAFSKYLTYDARNGLTHIFYTSYPYFGRAETLYYWNIEMQPSEPVKVDWLDAVQNQEYNSLAAEVDSLGNVHVAWHVDFDSAGSNWYRIIYANNSTGQWVKQVVSPAIDLGGFESGGTYFAVQQDGIAHILYQGEPYCDLECQAFYVRNDSLNGTDWITDTLPKPSRPLWYYWAGPIEVDQQDKIHLITGGCTQEDCYSAGKTRTFYYCKEPGESIWQGGEQIPDTMLYAPFRIDDMFIDQQGIPYLSYALTTNEVFFTGRKQGAWQIPYLLVGWNQELSDSFMVDDFSFVLDSQGKGHAVFAGFNFAQGSFENDSVEVYYLSSSNSSVDSLEDNIHLHHSLSQNYPNPFNSGTTIQYVISAGKREPVHTTLKIYNILGKEARELVDATQRSGFYRVTWDGKNNAGEQVASGLYFCQLRAGDYKETKRLVLIK